MNTSTSIANELNILKQTKQDIQAAIIDKGQAMSADTAFSDYSDHIQKLSDVKLFSSYDEMLEDTSSKNEQIGLVYEYRLENVKSLDEVIIEDLYFPKEVQMGDLQELYNKSYTGVLYDCCPFTLVHETDSSLNLTCEYTSGYHSSNGKGIKEYVLNVSIKGDGFSTSYTMTQGDENGYSILRPDNKAVRTSHSDNTDAVKLPDRFKGKYTIRIDTPGTVWNNEPANPATADHILPLLYHGNIKFTGVYMYKDNGWRIAPSQLQAVDTDVMAVPFYGKEGLSEGTFNSIKYFTDENISDVGTFETSFDSLYDTMDTTNITNWIKFNSKAKIQSPRPRYINIQSINNGFRAFQNCGHILQFPASGNWNMSNIVDGTYMFDGCTSLSGLSTANWRMPNLVTGYGMFCNCSNYAPTLAMTNFMCNNIANTGVMFVNTKIQGCNMTNWSNLQYAVSMFANCHNLTFVNTYNTSFQNVSSTRSMFEECHKLGIAYGGMGYLNNRSYTNTKDMSRMFYNCQNVYMNMHEMYMPNVTNTDFMFYNCKNLGYNKSGLYIPNFMQMNNLVNCRSMFQNCTNITSLHLSNYSVYLNNVKYSGSMFANCYNLSSYQTYGQNVMWRMPNLISGVGMFANCHNFSPNICWNMPYMNDANLVRECGITNITMGATDNLCNLSSMINVNACNKLTTVNINSTNYYKLSTIQFNNAVNLLDITINGIITNNGISALSFRTLPNLKNISLTNINYADNVSLSNFMTGCSSITEVNMHNWNIPNINNISNAFVSCSNLQTIDMSGIDLSKIATISNAFRSLPNVTDINLSNTDLGNVTYINNSFTYLPNLTNLDLSALNGEKVTYTNYAFFECHNLRNINLPYMNKITNAHNMFSNCYNLDINCIYGKIDMNNIYNIDDMFYRNFNIYNLDLKQLMGETCTRANMSFMFRTCINIRNISFANMNLPNLGSLHYTFYWAGPVETVDFTNCDLHSLSSMSYTFGFSSMIDCTIKNLNAPNLTSMAQTFFNCHSLQNITFENFNAPNLNSVTNCFANRLSGLKRINFVNANLCSLKTPGLMFVNCGQISHLNYHGANLDSATTLLPDSGWYCSSNLHYLDYSDAYTPNITTLGICYRDTSGSRYLSMLTDYNAANIDTTKVLNLGNVFRGASKLVNIDFTNCIFSNVTNITNMFYGCNNLSTASIDQAINMFLSCRNLPAANKTLNVNNTLSPFYRSTVTKTKYADRVAELEAAGWNL